MEDYKNQMNKWDYIVTIASGALTAALDIFWVKEISLRDAHSWGAKKTEDFVIKVVQSKKSGVKDLAIILYDVSHKAVFSICSSNCFQQKKCVILLRIKDK